MRQADNKSHGGKLTASQVLAIRQRYTDGGVTQRQLAAEQARMWKAIADGQRR